MVYIHGFDCVSMLHGLQILSGRALNEISCYCPGGCGGNIPYISAYKGCHIIVHGCL